MERVTEIESNIFDSQIRSLKLDWVNSQSIEIEFLKLNSVIRLNIQDIVEFDVFENEFEPHYISHIKCLINENNEICLSLDPYDENINQIEERDNFKIKFKTYKIVIEEI